MEVRTRNGLRRDPAGERRFSLTSACGVCGKAALEFVERAAPPVEPGPPAEPELVLRLPADTRAAQPGFERIGGLHATGLFDRDGRLLALREDVGRHNAMDKAVGAAAGGQLPVAGRDRGATYDGELANALKQRRAVRVAVASVLTVAFHVLRRPATRRIWR